MVSWTTIQSLLFFFGPMLVPRALAFYRSLRAPSNVQPQPVPTSTSRALNILFATALVALVSTFPFFTPRNIFDTTKSRLQTPTNVLFTRLSALGALAPSDESLRSVFEKGGLEARLLYLRFGPDVLASSAHLIVDPRARDAGTAYLMFALPSLLSPHLFHLAVLGLVTSAWFAGRDAARWRMLALVAGAAVACADLGAAAVYEHGDNARATRAAEMDKFFWKRRVLSRLAVCVVDGVVGWVVYLTATRRAFVEPKPAAERVEAATRAAEGVLGKLRGLGAVRNVVFRDTLLRSRLERYWVQEQEVMRSVFEDREVVGALNETLGALDMNRIENDADTFVDNILGGYRVVHQDNTG